jgi:hypothetical protein
LNDGLGLKLVTPMEVRKAKSTYQNDTD